MKNERETMTRGPTDSKGALINDFMSTHKTMQMK